MMHKIIGLSLLALIVGCSESTLSTARTQEVSLVGSFTAIDSSNYQTDYDLLPAHQYYSVARKDFFLAVTPQEYVDAGKDGGGYTSLSNDFCVVTSGGDNLKALYLHWSDLNEDNMTSVFENVLGYRNARLQGYILVDSIMGSVPLLQYYDSETKDYLVSSRNLNEFDYTNTYVYVRKEGYVFPSKYCSIDTVNADTTITTIDTLIVDQSSSSFEISSSSQDSVIANDSLNCPKKKDSPKKEKKDHKKKYKHENDKKAKNEVDVDTVVYSSSSSSENSFPTDLPELKAAYVYKNFARKDYFLAVNDIELSDTQDGGGYALVSHDFCILKNSELGTKAMTLKWSWNYLDNYSTVSDNLPTSYNSIRLQGYVYNEYSEGLVPLNQYYSEENSDFAISTQPIPDYTLVGVEGFVYPANACSGN